MHHNITNEVKMATKTTPAIKYPRRSNTAQQKPEKEKKAKHSNIQLMHTNIWS